MMRGRVFFLIAVLSMVSGPLAPVFAETIPAPPSAITLRDAERGFALLYPKEWSFYKTDRMIVFVSPSTDRGFQENANLIATRRDKAPLFRDYRRMAVREIREGLPGAVIHGQKKIILSGRPAHQMCFSVNLQGIPLRILQVSTVTRSHSYVFTYTADEKDYASRLAEVKSILQSLALA